MLKSRSKNQVDFEDYSNNCSPVASNLVKDPKNFFNIKNSKAMGV